MSKSPKKQPEQLLHLVFGGELTDLDGITFKDVASLDIVGIYPNFEKAQKAWLAKARETIDNAQMRYFICLLYTSPSPRD